MRDPRHVHCFGCVVYLVHDALIADADSPFLIAADKFFASRGRETEASRSTRTAIRATILAGSPYNSFSALAVRERR
jgi:hypothetical protein